MLSGDEWIAYGLRVKLNKTTTPKKKVRRGRASEVSEGVQNANLKSKQQRQIKQKSWLKQKRTRKKKSDSECKQIYTYNIVEKKIALIHIIL